MWNLTNGHYFVKNHLKSGQKCPDFKWLGPNAIAMAKAKPFEKRTISNPTNRISNFSGFQMVGFQIPTVFILLSFIYPNKTNWWYSMVTCNYLELLATLIEQNILKDSNSCVSSLLIRQQSKDLKNLISGNGLPIFLCNV